MELAKVPEVEDLVLEEDSALEAAVMVLEAEDQAPEVEVEEGAMALVVPEEALALEEDTDLEEALEEALEGVDMALEVALNQVVLSLTRLVLAQVKVTVPT